MGELKEKGDFRTLVDLVAENRASTERMATVVARERAMAEVCRLEALGSPPLLPLTLVYAPLELESFVA